MKSEMYAIAEIAGDQVVLEAGKKIAVPRLDVEEGKEFIVDSVLYYRNGNDVKIGNPTVKGVQISTVVVEHKRLPKVIVFKKKRRKGYRVKNGHRQPYTLLEVKGLNEAKKAEPKSKASPKKVSNPTEAKPEVAAQKE